MNFQHPLLLLLIAVPVLLGWAHHHRSLSRTDRLRFPALMLALSLLVVALANPYWRLTAEKEVVRGVDYVVILDVSQSMFCMEGTQRRMDRAIRMLNSLLPRMTGSSAGVVYFAGDARVGCPLTPDLASLPLFLESVTPGMTATMGTSSTSLPAAVEEILAAREAQRKTIGLLFSDGEFKDGGRALAAWVKDRADFTLFTVLCGNTRSPVPELDLSLPHPGAFSQPDPKAMADLASAGGGNAFDLTRAPVSQIENALMSGVRESISAGRQVPDYSPLPFVAVAAVLLLFYQLYPSLSVFRPGARTVAAGMTIVLLCVSLAMKDHSQDPADLFASALKDTKEKKYDEAIHKLQQLEPSGEVEIALGNVAFARGNYDEAINRYSAALRENPASDCARWNWEVALKRKSNQGPPPPPTPPPPAPPPPQQLPKDVSALLKYFDQQEKEQLRRNNQQHESANEFAW